MNVPFSVNTCEYVFTPVIVSFRPVSIAVTFPVVLHVVEYTTFAVGAVISTNPPVLFISSSALCIISITYHLISGLLGLEISFITQDACNAVKCFR